MNSYYVGNLIQVTGTFKNAAGALTDTTATCTVEDPGFTVTTPAVTHASLGVYTANIDLTAGRPGVWWYRFSGTGGVQAANEQNFYVQATNV